MIPRMKFAQALLLALVLLVAGGLVPASAGPNDPLFINLTTDDDHRADMAITFGKNQLARGHPLTIFLNDRAVHLGARANAGRYAHHQQLLTELAGKGATLIACPMCMKHYGVLAADLLPGIQVGKPELTGGALFRDNTKTLTW